MARVACRSPPVSEIPWARPPQVACPDPSRLFPTLPDPRTNESPLQEQLKKTSSPTLFLHGLKDGIVSHLHSLELYRACRAPLKVWHLLPHCPDITLRSERGGGCSRNVKSHPAAVVPSVRAHGLRRLPRRGCHNRGAAQCRPRALGRRGEGCRHHPSGCACREDAWLVGDGVDRIGGQVRQSLLSAAQATNSSICLDIPRKEVHFVAPEHSCWRRSPWVFDRFGGGSRHASVEARVLHEKGCKFEMEWMCPVYRGVEMVQMEIRTETGWCGMDNVEWMMDETARE